MAFYRQVGEVPPKRHTQFRRPDGGLYAEELMGEEGFSSDSSLLYHSGVPSAMVDARPWALPDQTTTPNSPLLPRHLRLHELFPGEEHKATDPVTGRRLVLGNADVRLSYAVSSLPSPLYRNATGDECVFVERGTATVETVFGMLDVGPGDYVVLPRATTHRRPPAAPRGSGRERPRPGGCGRGRSRCARTRSRRTATSARRSATCRSTGSCWSTRRTASGTCAGGASRSPPRAPTWRCT